MPAKGAVLAAPVLPLEVVLVEFYASQGSLFYLDNHPGHPVTTVNIQPVYLQAIDSVNSGPMLNFRTVDKKRRGDDTTQQA